MAAQPAGGGAERRRRSLDPPERPAARALLTIVAKNPKAALKALAA
jgi:hypothetical protein